LVYRTMKNIKGYIEHIVQESEETGKELPLDTRQYVERKVDPYISMQSKDLSGFVSNGWKPRIGIQGVSLFRLYNDSIGLIECIPMYAGKDVIVVRLNPKDNNRPLEYFTREGGFAGLLTFNPEEDREMLTRMCVDFTRSVARKLQRAQKPRNLFGV
jgi:hypothetical protein